MFDNVKKKINDIKVEEQKKKEEAQRLEEKKLEQEKQKLLAMNEKELLIEIVLMIKDISKENESLSKKIEYLEGIVTNTNFQINNLKN